MKAPTRALIVEDHDTWVSILDRAARRAGASEVVACEDLPAVKEALRRARFDVAILDVGLDPDDQLNSDGIKVLELIREIDGAGTRCVLVTGWQGGDRLDLLAKAQRDHSVDWAYTKENYEAHTVIAKLSELLDQAATRRLSHKTPMENLCAGVEPWLFENTLTAALSPKGGVQTLWSLASRLLSSAIPAVAMNPAKPMEQRSDGLWIGLYWSRALAAALAVGVAPAVGWPDDAGYVPSDLVRLLPQGTVPELMESKRERNIQGCLWELPGVGRDMFPG